MIGIKGNKKGLIISEGEDSGLVKNCPRVHDGGYFVLFHTCYLVSLKFFLKQCDACHCYFYLATIIVIC